MEKFNKIVEKYEIPLWQAVVSVWFFIEYFCHKEVDSLFGDGVFWAVFALLEVIKIKMKSKKK